jgi:capsular polysaccharide biosynthesis protein
MNYNPTEQSGRTDAEQRNGEAELFAEILYRLDEKQKQEQDDALDSENGTRQSVNLIELFYYLISKWHLILLGMVLGAVVLGFYAVNFITPYYTATSKLYIMGTTGSSLIYDLQIGSALTMDYQEVFQTWEVHQMVNEELGTNYSYSMLQSLLTVSNPDDTRILYITVRHPDSQTAADIANAYAAAAKRFIVQTMNTDEPSTFSIALVPSAASSGGITSYVIRGFLLGTVLVVGMLVLVFLLDSRPKSPDDIMRCANIPTLAVIPANPELSGGKGYGKAGKK